MGATTTKKAAGSATATATDPRAEGSTQAQAPAAQGTTATKRPDRRGMLRAMAGIAAATLGAGVLAESQAGPVAASDGQTVSLGQVTTAEHRTTVLYDGAAGFRGVVLAGSDSTYDGSSALYPAAVGGFAGAGATAGTGGVTTGVFGQSDSKQGFGVVGYNGNGGTGVFGDGHNGNIGVYGRSDSGDAVYAISQTGTAVSAVSGQGAVAAVSSSTGGYAAAVSAVLNTATPGDWSAAVRGVNNGTGTRGIGVYGIHNGGGQGVLGYSYHGTGVWAASGSGYGAECTGGLAPLRLDPASTAGAPTTGAHQPGELYVDSNGVLYFCTASGTPGTWKTVQLV